MKSIEDYDFYEIGREEARNIGPFGDDDGPVTVTCYRETETWRSRKAARAYYEAGSDCSSGHEQYRYFAIVDGIDAGLAEVTDEEA